MEEKPNNKELIERMLATRQKLIDKIDMCSNQIREAKNTLNGLNNEICRLNGHTFGEPIERPTSNYDCYLETTCLICGITKIQNLPKKKSAVFTKKEKKRIRKYPAYDDHDMWITYFFCTKKWTTSYNLIGDYMERFDNGHTHTVSVIDRNSINISGVNKIESFDNEEFLLETVMGYMDIKGSNLEIVKLDTIEGNVVIKGQLNNLIYIEDIKKKKTKEEGVISRLFKWYLWIFKLNPYFFLFFMVECLHS